MAESKEVDFHIRFSKDLPRSVFTDAKRLQQIIKNLLSNAFKFTHQGAVTLTVHPVKEGWSHDNEDLVHSGDVLAFSVSDSGIGIAADKQKIIFEAFQQADGSTSRKYGGTGLGLAISRELSRLLHGEIVLASTPGKGSTFTLFLPVRYATFRPKKSMGKNDVALLPPPPAQERPDAAQKSGEHFATEPVAAVGLNLAGDDRGHIDMDDHVVLIAENDLTFARLLLEAAREKGFKGLVTTLGASALAMASDHAPEAIMLDIHLPDMQGWRVLDRLKNDMATRHIPIYVISTDDARERAWGAGAFAFISKPVRSKDQLDALFESINASRGRKKNLLVVEPSAKRRKELTTLLACDDLKVTAANNATAAMRAMDNGHVDGILTASEVPDLPAKLAQRGTNGDGAGDHRLPVFMLTPATGTQDDPGKWNLLKNDLAVHIAHSTDRLLDLTALHLHLNVARLPAPFRELVHDPTRSNRLLAGKKVLIVDDDIRNIFALSSVLEECDMVILSAENGRDAIRILQKDPGIHIVLMDIMMPEMDGMETTREIRKLPGLTNLPIIAVTAKAMKGDREKCIEAGAWDYLSKPVDTEQMLSMLRGWLHR
jgi:CheY-like chemotaxis protein